MTETVEVGCLNKGFISDLKPARQAMNQCQNEDRLLHQWTGFVLTALPPV